MSLSTAIIVGIIIVGVIGTVIYFIIKSKSNSPPINSDKPILLQINAGSVENQK